MTPEPDDDLIDPNLCDISSDEYALSTIETEFFPLFPDGVADGTAAAEWRALFPKDES